MSIQDDQRLLAVDPSVWERERRENPQAVIDALVGQTARQGEAIHALLQELSELRDENAKLKGEAASAPLLNYLGPADPPCS